MSTQVQTSAPGIFLCYSLFGMNSSIALDALVHEANRLSQEADGLSETEWDRPTRCEPWSVRELLGHIRVVLAWVPEMLAAPAPEAADIDAVEYYRPDARFSEQTNTARIELARDYANQHVTGASLVKDFTATWQRVEEMSRQESAGRVVRTRHGDAMLLSDFLLTRVVEVAVHGLDLADALERDPWLTPEAGSVLLDLLAGPDHIPAIEALEWDPEVFLRKATGRADLTDEERAEVTRLGVQWLTLG